MKKILLSLFLSFGCFSSFSLEACTGMRLNAKDGSFVHGRTLEFGIEVDISLGIIPRGYAFKGTTPEGAGLSYTSKYGAVGAMAFGDPAFMDGLNEKGLAVGTFYFPTFAGYSPITKENQSKALSSVEFPNWILTQFATVKEVKEALNQVVIAPTINKAWGPTAAPFHYIVFDKSGDCLVIEPIDGKLITHENKLGTFTNSPNFEWHMENLRNFINLSPVNAKPITLNGIVLKPFGEGSGMVGVPGDFTPPSRFVRAAIYSTTAIAPSNADEAVFQMFHLLNQFDIPVGVARDDEKGVIYSDKTQLTCVRNPQNLKYYFKSYKDQNIQVVDLNYFDLNAKEIKSLKVDSKEKALDVSSQLKE